ncbi:ABC transporter substrate-binding protein [Nocardia paucivorans]|uniref:ABC transporter substrate-binding protein n=1 Tax=Nocardia paucivorans TaxID=114259 RepID=UPI0005932C91|nr:ABC transporter substrate-binding protein [Nocardia paucivorans]
MQVVRRSPGGLRAVFIALAAALALGLAGCGATNDTTGSGTGVTIGHAHGETVVEGTPTRIVALGNQWLDAVQALGITPIGYLDNVAIGASRTPPWEPNPKEAATSIDMHGDIPEQVAALAPDLILADTFVADPITYEKLSKIAPTLPGLAPDTVTPWQDQVTALGRVLGKQDEAAKVIEDIQARIDALAQAYPGLRGKTFASTYLAGPTQLMVLNDPNDGSTELFTSLGMSIPEHIRSLPATMGRAALSAERAGELTVDLLLAGYANGLDGQYRKLPGYEDLPAVRKNAVVFLDYTDISAINQPTALSLPYILDKLRPALAAAAK